MLKRILLILLVVALLFLAVLLVRCPREEPVQPAPPVEHKTVEDEPVQGVPPVVHPEAGKVVPGRVRVVLDRTLWRPEFPAATPVDEPEGIQRLALSPELEEVLSCFRVQRIWRSMAHLERRTGDRVRVVSFADRVRELKARGGGRENARDYEPPDLAGAAGGFEMKFPDETDLKAVVKALAGVPGVISAKGVISPPPQLPFFPNDPGWIAPGSPGYDSVLAKGRWGFHNSGTDLDPAFIDGFDIDAPEAWEFQRGNAGFAVAVLDAGVDVTHPDLYLNIFLNEGEVPAAVVTSHRGASPDDGLPGQLTFYDLNVPSVRTALESSGWSDTNGNGYIDGEDVVAWWSFDANGDGDPDDDGNGYTDDLVGWNFETGDNRPFGTGSNCSDNHGTCSAGLIAALGNNGAHIAGVAHGVRILPVKSSFVIGEVAYAVSFPPVRVINHSMSWSFDGLQSDINAVFSTLEPEGVLYVASLGNLDGFYYGADPSQRESVMSITNFGGYGHRSRGGASGYGPKTDVAAPGSGLYSLATGGTSWFGGTSAASPMTAGVAALIASQDPTLTPEQIRQVIRMTAVDPPAVPDDAGENTSGWDLYSGWGLANAGAAIAALRSGRVFAEANILSLPKNYYNRQRNEEFSVRMGGVPIRGYLGLPGGGGADWTLRRSPDWDLGGSTVDGSGTGMAYSDGTVAFHTVATDPLDGRQILELSVTTPAGETSRERAVIDLPRAYLADFASEDLIIENQPLHGFAYGPGFSSYHIFIAPGWTPAPADFVEIHSSTSEQAPTVPAEAGSLLGGRTLMPLLDIFSLPVTLPASGEATLRVVTEGARSWTFNEKVVIDNVQPPGQSGFPVDGFYTASPSPTAADLDGDGALDLVAAGSGGAGAVKALRGDGTDLPGFPVILSSGELIAHSPAVGDVDGDGRPEVVVRTWPTETTEGLRVINHDGSLVGGSWPVTFDNPDGSYYSLPDQNPPVLADVTLDGRLDILVSVDSGPPALTHPVVRAFRGDGTVIRDYAAADLYQRLTPPVVGDIDGDDEPEIAAVAWTPGADDPALLYVWQRDGSVAWTAEVREVSSRPLDPVLADVDDDGRLEVMATTGWGPVRVFDDDGTLLNGIGGYFGARMSPAQLRPSAAATAMSLVFGNTESVSGTWGSHLRVVEPISGTEAPGWAGGIRVGDPDARMQPVIADLTGDSDLEIAYGNGYTTRLEDPEYTLSLWEDDGTAVIAGGEWPLRFSGTLWATPVVADLDGDGDLELAVQTSQPTSKIYVYDLPAPADAGAVGWGQYGHDPRRSGNYHGDLRILSPTTVGGQVVGPHDDTSRQALLLVRTHFARGGPSEGLNTANWTVTIGGSPASVREVQKVQGEHWLLVEPVTQSTAGSYNLRVTFNDGGIRTWDAYRSAVIYENPAQNHTQIAVVDRSGSMLSAGKIEAARAAGRFFMEATYPDDEVGVVSFDTAATSEIPAGLVPAGANRALVAGAVTGVTPLGTWAMTSIGAGLDSALDLLESGAIPVNRWGLVLLSDGLENTPPYWSLSGGPGPVRPRVETMMAAHPDFEIHTIALGPDADQDLLEDIATFGNGTFYPVYLGNSLSMLNRLADVYHASRERIDRTRRLLSHGRTYAREESWTETVAVGVGTRRLQFAFNWDRPGSLSAGTHHAFAANIVAPLGIEVVRPDGSALSPADPGVGFTSTPTDAVFTVPSPVPGDWRIRVTGLAQEGIEVLTVVSAELPLGNGVLWGPSMLREGVPTAVLLAYLTDANGFLRDAVLTATVTGPDKSVRTIRLSDDGRSGDGAAGDGIFGTPVPMPLAGSYLVSVQAAGNAASGPFQLQETTGHFNRLGSDRDGDGLPDEWERRFNPGCGAVLTPSGDPDGDGLDNAAEWRFGSSPVSADTDGDGRSDREELQQKTNPNDPER